MQNYCNAYILKYWFKEIFIFGEYPILILDDVFSELDETRQKLLVDNLSVVQMFITTAEVSHKNIFDRSNTTIFNIEQGRVINIENGGN